MYFDAAVVFVTRFSLLLRFGPGHAVICNICTTMYENYSLHNISKKNEILLQHVPRQTSRESVAECKRKVVTFEMFLSQ